MKRKGTKYYILYCYGQIIYFNLESESKLDFSTLSILSLQKDLFLIILIALRQACSVNFIRQYVKENNNNSYFELSGSQRLHCTRENLKEKIQPREREREN